MSKNRSSENISVAIAISIMLLAAVLVSSCSVKGPLTEAQIISSVADQVADYSVPEGYHEEFAVDMLGYQVINLQGPDPSCHIYMVQSTDNASITIEDLKEKADTAQVGSESGRYSDVEVVEQREATIRGQEVTLLVGEGTTSDGEPFRQVNAVFEGRGGPALVNISAPEDLWDWDLVDSFLASMK